MNPDDFVEDALIEQGLDQARLGAGVMSKVRGWLRKLYDRLVSILGRFTKSKPSRGQLQAAITDADKSISEYVKKAQGELVLKDVAELFAAKASKDLGTALATQAQIAAAAGVVIPGVALAAQEQIAGAAAGATIEGGAVSAWWSRHTRDTQFRFANIIRGGIAAGEATEKMVEKVEALIGASERSARSLVLTSIANVTSAARARVYEANKDILQGFKQVSTLDSRTTLICMAYSGCTWDVDYNPTGPKDRRKPFTTSFGNGCPRHWQCRSVIVPITKPLEGIPDFKASTRASIDGPVSGSITFSKWLDSKSTAFQDEALGKGRADLWRSGTITLSQLLDARGNPLTLEQLRKKYAGAN